MWMWSTGINRNIVECKGPASSDSLILPLVLIETLWNVKTRVTKIAYVGIEVLIETLWNVKSGVDKNVVIETICINRNIVECKAL